MSRTPAHPSPAAQITNAILERLEAGMRPWVKPWSGAPPALPKRACGTPYTGINRFWLWLMADERGYASSYWMTYRRASELGGQVRRGERATIAIFYKSYRRADPDSGDEDDRRLVLRTYAVFNADQIEGLPPRFRAATLVEPAIDPTLGAVAAFFHRIPGRVITGSRAAYDRVRDIIEMPAPACFADPARYYATLAHERAHWTGHPSRLAREFGARFGDAAYAVEELTAELASAILGAELGLPVDHLENHAAYIGAWIEVLRADARAVLSVAAKAEAAANYLLAIGRAAELAAPAADGAAHLPAPTG